MAGRRLERTVRLVDVFPTLLELAGLAPASGALSGRSLASVLRGAPEPEEVTTYAGGDVMAPERMVLIRRSVEADVPAIAAIINEAARAYRGVIPVDRWHEPYMPTDELKKEILGGVVFWVAEEEGRLLGVMGIQDKGDVALVRHAYVAPSMQRSGVGTRLLRHVEGLADKPILIGTWASASWAIEFYQRNGFTVVSTSDKDRLLQTYWSIPARQIETSVVLADGRWMEAQGLRGA